MTYLEDHRVDGKNIKGGWIVFAGAYLVLFLLTL